MLRFAGIAALPRSAPRTLACALATGIAVGFLAAIAAGKPLAAQGSPGANVLPEHGGIWLESPGEAHYDTIAQPLPPNVPSLAYEATGTSEFGDRVRLDGTAHYIESVTVVMSSWALRSDYPGSAASGYTHPVTLNLYTVDRSRAEPRPGKRIASFTQSFLVPWRPEPDPEATSPLRPWRGADGNRYPGRAFTISFDLGALEGALPDEIVFGIAFDTEHYGARPRRVPGPYNRLHVGVAEQAPQVGADLEPDAVYWRTAQAAEYADGGRAGVDVFRRDTRWTPYRPAVRFNLSAYGALAALADRLAVLPAPDAATATMLDRAEVFTRSAIDRRLWRDRTRLQPEAGRIAFDVLAAAASELAPLARRRDALGERATAAVEAMTRAAESLAELAIGEAVMAGRVGGFQRAQDALDAAHAEASLGQADRALARYGAAWRETDAGGR